MLAATYYLLKHCFSNGGTTSESKTAKFLHLAHLGLVAILSLLYIAYFALGLRYIIDIYGRAGGRLNASYASYKRAYDYLRIQVAYQAIYFVATVEILALSIFLFVTKSKRGLSGKVSRIAWSCSSFTEILTIIPGRGLPYWSSSLPRLGPISISPRFRGGLRS